MASTVPEEKSRLTKRSLAGYLALGFYFLALVLVLIAFFSTHWVVSDETINGSTLESFGLWTHCSHSLPTDSAELRNFVGCHWIFNPFTNGYKETKGYFLPFHFMVTQFFYSLTFLGTLVSVVGSSMVLLRSSPRQKSYIHLTLSLGITLILSGICGAITVLIFALFTNQSKWMPGHDYNFFGWSFGVAIASFIALLISGAFYLVETNIQKEKENNLRQPQSKFYMETTT